MSKYVSKFFVNEEKKVVVCKMYEVYEYGGSECVSSAKVTCKDDDVFDLNKGKQMAYARTVMKLSTKVIKEQETKIANLQKEIDKTQEDIDHNKSVYEWYEKEYNDIAK